VRYYQRPEFPAILRQAITEAQNCLREHGSQGSSTNTIWERVEGENHESDDHRVRPLEGRLTRIFNLRDSPPDDLLEEMCRAFLRPIFACGQVYDDSLSTLEQLRARGFRTAIVSNSPWGSPARLWREEISRLGVGQLVDTAVFCGDVGWRKPACQIFEYALEKLHASPERCVFVGDDPRWDLVGPRAIGIDALLIDREGIGPDTDEKPLRNLQELLDQLTQPAEST